jgi:transcriptional regulator with XRE-family HTH domain
MILRGTICQQLRLRRQALGLSLRDVARRAGTSAATLSRYEDGWTRFETHTLRKLATALDCDLHIALEPRKGRRPKLTHTDDARRLRRLFWDQPLRKRHLETHPVWVVERVLEYGGLADVHSLQRLMGNTRFLRAAARAERLSPRTRSFWREVLALEGMPCTTRFSRNTAWTC